MTLKNVARSCIAYWWEAYYKLYLIKSEAIDPLIVLLGNSYWTPETKFEYIVSKCTKYIFSHWHKN